MNHILVFGLYRAVSTVRHGYKNQSFAGVQKHIDAVGWRNVDFLVFNLVYMVTTRV
jgi:hypothetical protein